VNLKKKFKVIGIVQYPSAYYRIPYQLTEAVSTLFNVYQTKALLAPVIYAVVIVTSKFYFFI
jgi:hypothetical protein